MALSNQLEHSESSRPVHTHGGMAFLVEALIILAFLMTALAIFAQLFSSAQLEGRSAERMSRAVMAATNTAEEFSAHPTSVDKNKTEGDLTVTCEIEDAKRDSGTLYNATITVFEGEEQLYTLHTARYVSTQDGGAQ